MGNFYNLDSDEQAARLQNAAQVALKEWGREDASLTLIKIRENAVYRAQMPDGEQFVVRVHRAGYNTDAELQSEFEWMEKLNEAGIQTPAIIHADDGSYFKRITAFNVPESRQIDLLGWVEGTPIGTIEEGFGGDLQSALANFTTLGQLAARMHNLWQTWTPPQGFTRGAFDLEGLVGDEPRWGPFWKNPFLDKDGTDLVLRARARLCDDLTAFGVGDDRFGLLHADLIPENLLVTSSGMRVIDFDDAAFGWHMFELATTLSWHVGETYFNDAVAHLIAGYREHREIPDEHVDLLPMFLAAKFTTFLGWMTTRSETAEVKQIGPSFTADALEFLESYLTSG